jgi:hypothetical protein
MLIWTVLFVANLAIIGVSFAVDAPVIDVKAFQRLGQ